VVLQILGALPLLLRTVEIKIGICGVVISNPQDDELLEIDERFSRVEPLSSETKKVSLR